MEEETALRVFLWVVQTPKTQDSEDDRFINEDQRVRDGFFFFQI